MTATRHSLTADRQEVERAKNRRMSDSMKNLMKMAEVKAPRRLNLVAPIFPDMRGIVTTFAQIRPYGGASLIYADPPWRHVDRSPKGDKTKTTDHQYQTQPLEWIGQLPVDILAAKDCLLWIWTTAPLLRATFGVIEAWGFEYKTSGAWVKRGSQGGIAMGLGRRLRTSHEPFIIATRGQPRVGKAIRSVIMAEGDEATPDDPFAGIGATIEAVRREHSRKPDEAAVLARQCVDGPAVELFGRQPRAGWTVWGNQSDKFAE